MDMLKVMLKKYMTNRIMMKEKEKYNYKQGKTKKLIGLIKHQEVGKIDTKLAALSTKTHAYIVQKCDHKIKKSEFKKVTGIKSQHLKC